MRGDRACGFDANHLTTGFSVRVAGDATRWHAEYAIPLATIGATAGQIAGMDVLARPGRLRRRRLSLVWCALRRMDRPRDRADVRLATDPDDPGNLDLDGMADAWELANLGSTNTDGTGDADGDGQTRRRGISSRHRSEPTGVTLRGHQLRAGRRLPAHPLAQRRGSVDYLWKQSDMLQDWDPDCTNLPGTGTPLTCLINPALPEAGRFFRRPWRQRCPQ